MNNYGRRRRKSLYRQKTGMNFNVFIGIILIAVLAGFLTTRFFVYPLVLKVNPDIGGGSGDVVERQQDQNQEGGTQQATPAPVHKDADENASQAPQSTDIVEDQLQVNQVSSTGYAVQFGSFSTKEAAQTLIEQLLSSGISAQIVEKDGAFKVLGQLFENKQQAVDILKTVDRAVYKDVFVTQN